MISSIQQLDKKQYRHCCPQKRASRNSNKILNELDSFRLQFLVSPHSWFFLFLLQKIFQFYAKRISFGEKLETVTLLSNSTHSTDCVWETKKKNTNFQSEENRETLHIDFETFWQKLNCWKTFKVFLEENLSYVKLLSLGDLVRENSKITESVMWEKNQILSMLNQEKISTLEVKWLIWTW